MKRALIVFSVVIMGSLLLYAQGRVDMRGGRARYQLIPASVTVPSAGGSQVQKPAVFLVDAETGRCWEYQTLNLPIPQPAQGRVFQPYFAEVPVEKINFTVEKFLESYSEKKGK
jgi:hypothetical protein